MRDPLSNQADDPYELLGVRDDCTPMEAESALDALLVRTRGRENDGLNACDILRDPVRRLTIDIFRYPTSAASPPEPAAAELDAIDGLIVRKSRDLVAALAWDRVMPVISVDDIPLSGDSAETPRYEKR